MGRQMPCTIHLEFLTTPWWRRLQVGPENDVGGGFPSKNGSKLEHSTGTVTPLNMEKQPPARLSASLDVKASQLQATLDPKVGHVGILRDCDGFPAMVGLGREEAKGPCLLHRESASTCI